MCSVSHSSQTYHSSLRPQVWAATLQSLPLSREPGCSPLVKVKEALGDNTTLQMVMGHVNAMLGL